MLPSDTSATGLTCPEASESVEVSTGLDWEGWVDNGDNTHTLEFDIPDSFDAGINMFTFIGSVDSESYEDTAYFHVWFCKSPVLPTTFWTHASAGDIWIYSDTDYPDADYIFDVASVNDYDRRLIMGESTN